MTTTLLANVEPCSQPARRLAWNSPPPPGLSGTSEVSVTPGPRTRIVPSCLEHRSTASCVVASCWVRRVAGAEHRWTEASSGVASPARLRG